VRGREVDTTSIMPTSDRVAIGPVPIAPPSHLAPARQQRAEARNAAGNASRQTKSDSSSVGTRAQGRRDRTVCRTTTARHVAIATHTRADSLARANAISRSSAKRHPHADGRVLLG